MRTMLKHALVYGIFLGTVVSTGLLHGMWTQRWSDDRDLEAAGRRLAQVPLQLGDWLGHDQLVDPAKLARAEVAGHLFRRYENQRTRQAVNLVLLCGRFGPLSVHTPDICYGGAGFRPMEEPERVAVNADDGSCLAELWTARFEKRTGPISQHLRVLWGWSAGDRWQAPDYPRLAFRTAPVLFKIYIVRDLTRPDEPIDGEPGCALLRQVIPKVETAKVAL